MNKVGGLVGTGSMSIPTIVGHQTALLPIQVIILPIKDIGNCPTVELLAALPIPPSDGGSPINLKALRSFFPTHM